MRVTSDINAAQGKRLTNIKYKNDYLIYCIKIRCLPGVAEIAAN